MLCVVQDNARACAYLAKEWPWSSGAPIWAGCGAVPRAEPGPTKKCRMAETNDKQLWKPLWTAKKWKNWRCFVQTKSF